MELKEMIMEATLDEFNEKSLKFTMDDVAKRLQISKKTIYSLFEDKEALFLETVDYCFAAIKAEEKKIQDVEAMDIVEKIKRILIVLPERQKNIDWRQVYVTKEKYPRIYEKIEKRIETEWDSTIELLEEGIRIGRLKAFSIPVFKIMVESSIEGFLRSSALIDNDISYEKALTEMIDMLMAGIEEK